VKLVPINHDSPFLFDVVNWLNDKEHMKFSGQRFQNHTIESQSNYYQKLKREGHLYFFGFDGNLLIGTITILFLHPHKTAEIGILISKELKGQGFGRKLLSIASQFAFDELDVEKQRAGCLLVNIPMIKTLESCGFIKEATFEKEEIWQQTRSDVVFYAKHKFS
jgi:RimJ/RimL family protein N-acetyltransferase